MTFINKFVNAFIVCGVIMAFIYWITSSMISYEKRITVLEVKNTKSPSEVIVPLIIDGPKRSVGPSKYDVL